MEIVELAAIGHGLATAVYACLSALMLSRWKNNPKSGWIALAAGITALWAAVQSFGSLGYLNAPVILLVAEWLRNFAWLGVLLSILRDIDEGRQAEKVASRYGALFLLPAGIFTVYYGMRSSDSLSTMGIVGGGIMMSALALILIEQVYRNAPFDARSSLKYFCVGLTGMYLYDLVVFSLTVVNQEMSINQWAARGFVNGVFAFPVALAAQRSFRLSLDVHIPRQILFYFFALIGVSLFIIFLLIGDYYVDNYGGKWSGVVRIVLFVIAVTAIAALMVSATIRARFRVFLMKSFFQYKYDYRKEWLRFIGTLTESEHENVSTIAIRAVAQIVNSPGGVAWVQEEDGKNYLPAGAWRSELPVVSSVEYHSPMTRFLRQRQWIIDLNEFQEFPARYEGLVLEPWLASRPEWWIVVPLFLRNRLFGFIILEKPRMVPSLNFEDHDLLRTVGRHVATHIDQAEADKRLAESSQFGTYNRLTAFLMHDLNNLIAQQSLVVKNAEKYRHNPDFVDDAIDTIAHSVARMRRLMEQLSSGSEQLSVRNIDLIECLKKAINRCAPRLPVPVLGNKDQELMIAGDADRITTVMEHLIRNAQDATEENGHIDIACEAGSDVVEVTIQDTGCGMSPAFIRERLFRPFDSTKGSQSMGIGAYQAREYLRQLGGQLEVVSKPGSGTTFRMRIPRS